MLQLFVMTKIWNTWAENVVEDEQEKFAEVIPVCLRDVSCLQCEFRLTTRFNLLNHIASHHGNMR